MVVGAKLSRPIEILLVEDNPAGVRLTEEALSEGNIPYHLNPHFPYQPCRTCRNQQQSYLM